MARNRTVARCRALDVYMTKAQRNAAKSDVCALVHVDPHAAIRRRSGEEIEISELQRKRTARPTSSSSAT